MATLSTFFDMVFVYATETSGDGPFTLGSAVTGFQTPASAGIGNGTPVSYRATDGVNWETAHGVIDVSGSIYTLTRGVDTIESSNSNELVDFGSGVTVVITLLSQDINALVSAGASQSFSTTQKNQARSNIHAAAGAAAVVSASGGNLAITGTTSYNMFGYGANGLVYTPTYSGTLLLIGIFRVLGTTTSATEGDDYALYYGTGTAPANGASATGTQATSITCSTPDSTQLLYPIVGIANGLTLGTKIWMDFAGLLGGGSATMQSFLPVVTVIEL